MAEQKGIKQAVILAGGMGLRLRPFTYDNPKAIVSVNGKPFLFYIIEMLKKQGIERIVMLLGYMPEKIQEYLGDGSRFGISVEYSIGAIEDSTGTRVHNAKQLLDDRFLLLYCDNYLSFPILDKLVEFHEAQSALVTTTVYSNQYGFTKNNVRVDAEGYVVQYDKVRMAPNLNGVDIGFFIFEKRALDLAPEGDFWIDADLFPALIEKKQLRGFIIDWPYYSLSTPERRLMTEKLLGPQKIIFLDRDGVINKKMANGEYVCSVSGFQFLSGAKEGMQWLVEHGYTIFVISNQAGIARGFMNEGDLFEIHKHMEQELEKVGVTIAGIYYCPHAWDAGCLCRKPKPGMLLKAAIDHQIDLPRATFIGDDMSDVEAGNAAGCKTILISPDANLLEIVMTKL